MAVRHYHHLWAKTAATIHLLLQYISKQHIQCCFQEIVKLKALELCLLFSKQLLTILGTERSDWPEFMCRMYFSPFKPYLHLRETLLNNTNAVEMELTHSELKASATSICFNNNFLTPIFLLATSEQHNTNLCIDLITYKVINVT